MLQKNLGFLATGKIGGQCSVRAPLQFSHESIFRNFHPPRRFAPPLQVSPTKHKCVSWGPMGGELTHRSSYRHSFNKYAQKKTRGFPAIFINQNNFYLTSACLNNSSALTVFSLVLTCFNISSKALRSNNIPRNIAKALGFLL